MFKSKHVTIKFRPPVIRGENLMIVDTNLKSKKLALALAHCMIHKYPGVKEQYESLTFLGTMTIEFDVHPLRGSRNLWYKRKVIDW